MMNQQSNKVEPKNMIMAVVLSMLIVFGWQYYYVAPQAKKQQEQAEVAKTQAANPSISCISSMQLDAPKAHELTAIGP